VRLRESGVVLPHVPIAVGALGLAAPPAEGDLVLVSCVGGDLHAPVVVGRLYDEEVAPPVSAAGQLVAWLPRAQSDESKRVEVLVETDGGRAISVRLAGDVEACLVVQDGRIELSVGAAAVTVSASSDSDAAAQLKVGDSTVRLEQSGDVTVEAAGKLTLKGKTVEISASGDVAVTGQSIALN
jgi:uncharacterized protein involved in type VI secretion and phage assembly